MWLRQTLAQPGGEVGRRTKHERRPKMRRGRHVMRSFVGTSTILPLSPSDGSKDLRSALILPTRHSQFKFQRNFDDEHHYPTAISSLQVGPPTRRELVPVHQAGHALLRFCSIIMYILYDNSLAALREYFRHLLQCNNESGVRHHHDSGTRRPGSRVMMVSIPSAARSGISSLSASWSALSDQAAA